LNRSNRKASPTKKLSLRASSHRYGRRIGDKSTVGYCPIEPPSPPAGGPAPIGQFGGLRPASNGLRHGLFKRQHMIDQGAIAACSANICCGMDAPVTSRARPKPALLILRRNQRSRTSAKRTSTASTLTLQPPHIQTERLLDSSVAYLLHRLFAHVNQTEACIGGSTTRPLGISVHWTAARLCMLASRSASASESWQCGGHPNRSPAANIPGYEKSSTVREYWNFRQIQLP